MWLTQELVDNAKALGFKLSTIGLYENRKPNEVFIRPHNGERVCFRKGSVILKHHQVQKECV